MLSPREIKQIVHKQYDEITARLVDANRNGDAHYTPNEAIKECTVFLSENPQLQRLEIQAAGHYKQWEKRRIQPTTRLNAEGQMQLDFGYQPKSVIIYGKGDRGFMEDMTFKDTLNRMRLLQVSLKHTTDGIHTELTFYTSALQAWDQQKQKTMDDVQKEVFGWQPTEEEPLSSEEDDFPNDET